MLVSGRVFKQFHWSIVSWSIYVLFLWGLFGWRFKVLNSFLRCLKSKVMGKDLSMVNRCFQIHPVEYGKLILKAGFCCLTMFDTSPALRLFFTIPLTPCPEDQKTGGDFVQKGGIMYWFVTWIPIDFLFESGLPEQEHPWTSDSWHYPFAPKCPTLWENMRKKTSAAFARIESWLTVVLILVILLAFVLMIVLT